MRRGVATVLFLAVLCLGLVSVAGMAVAETTYTLSVAKSGGDSSCLVQEYPIIYWINCGDNCTGRYSPDTSVTVRALAHYPLYTFSSWSGCDSWISGSDSCTVKMNSNRQVTATFKKISSDPILTVTKTGEGTVTSSPSGITCGSTCSAQYSTSTFVTLTTTPSTGYGFSSWSGCDTLSSDGSQCNVYMSADKTVTATFTQISYTLTVNKTGGGTVASSPSGIYCGSACSANYNYGTSVILVPDNSSSSWRGCDAISVTNLCTVAMTSNRYVNVSFGSLSINAAKGSIYKIYKDYASWFGTRYGGVTAVTVSSGTYYLQWFTNGTALVAWTDGNMYLYDAGNWFPIGINWTTTSDADKADAIIDETYNQGASWFLAKSGDMTTALNADGSISYYYQKCTNGAYIIASSDGNMYVYIDGMFATPVDTRWN
ncbi:MAG: hypothetical protein HQK98_11150 [Nitrospirae bacterium]|nr:hypothetical protein [Nitrospirota bacterium]